MVSRQAKTTLAMVLLIGVIGCTIPKSIGTNHRVAPDIDSLFGIACRSSSIERIIAYTSKALNEDSTCADCYLLRAVSWLRIGQLNEAYADIRRAAFVDPTLFPKVRALHVGRFSYQSLIGEFRALYEGRLADCDCVDATIFSSSHASLSPGLKNDTIEYHGDAFSRPDDASKKQPADLRRISRKEHTNTAQKSSHTIFELQESRTSTDHNKRSGYKESTAEDSRRENATTTEGSVGRDEKTVDEEQVKTTKKDSSGITKQQADTCTLEQARRGKDSTTYLCVAERLYNDREYKPVLRIGKEAIRRHKKYSEMYLLRAKSYGATHRYRKAIREVKKAIRYKPNASSYYLVEAWIYHCLGKYKKERKSLHTALRLGSSKRSLIQIRLESIADK